MKNVFCSKEIMQHIQNLGQTCTVKNTIIYTKLLIVFTVEKIVEERHSRFSKYDIALKILLIVIVFNDGKKL